MQDAELLSEGLALMGLGMGFVFVFLTVLVVITTLMSATVRRFFPEPTTADALPAGSAETSPKQDAELMGVISAAVHHYRRRHRR